MKKELIYTVVAILVIFSFFGIKKIIMDKHFKEALIELKKRNNLTFEESKILEQLYRNETAHFKSGQFQSTYSPGMEAFSSKFPYGWTTLNKLLWSKNKKVAPYALSHHIENETGKSKFFLKFPNLYSAMLANLTMARAYKDKGGFYRWWSTKPEKQKIYKERLDSIIPRITYKIYES